MKQIIKNLFVAVLSLVSFCCHAQQIVQNIADAKKLELNQSQFIGKPLKNLLSQIAPAIKLVYGNPDNNWSGATGGTYIKFHFVDKDEYAKRSSENKKPTGIIVNFQLDPENKHKPFPKGGLTEWTDEQLKEYGDMIIMKIRVTGEN